MPNAVPEYLPNDLSEANFRRYEEYIKRGVDRFPEETQFSVPSGTAPTTFVARFRSAIVSLKKFAWSTTVNTGKLWELTGAYSISRDFADGTVWFRVKHRAGRPTNLTQESRGRVPQIDSSPELIRSAWKDVLPDEITAICLLIHTGRLAGPIILQGEVPSDDIAKLETQFNVGLVYNDADKQTIIN